MIRNSLIAKEIEKWKAEENPKTALKNEYKAFHAFERKAGETKRNMRWLYHGHKKSKR
jgi:hypothetical protein